MIYKDMSIVLAVGHHKRIQGAKSKEYGVTEWQVNHSLVKGVAEQLTRDKWRVFTLYDISMTRKVKAINKIAPDIAIDFHLNAANGIVEGHEALYWYQSEYGKMLAEAMCRNVTINRDRGAKPVEHENGSYFCRTVRAVTVVWESAFIDNPKDYHIFDLHKGELVEQICAGLRAYCFERFQLDSRQPLLTGMTQGGDQP